MTRITGHGGLEVYQLRKLRKFRCIHNGGKDVLWIVNFDKTNESLFNKKR